MPNPATDTTSPQTSPRPASGRTRLRPGRAGLTAATLAVTGLLALAGASPVAAAAKPPAPSKVWVKTNSYGKFELAWSKVVKNVTSYQVTVASDSAMKKVVFRAPFTAKTHKWVVSSSLEEGATYYVQVRSYNTKATPGAASKTISLTTKVQPVKTPQNVVVTPVATDSVKVSWTRTGLATGYTVKLRPTKYGTPFWSKRTSSTSMTVTGLTDRAFFVTVTADRLKKTFQDSRTLIAATKQAVPETGVAFSARIGSYNVMQYNRHLGDHPWAGRRQAAANLIKDLDIVGVQEVTWAEAGPALGSIKRPVLQLAHLTGSLTLAMNPEDPARPCANHSVHLLVRSSLFDVTSCGQESLGSDNRYVTWADLEHKASGKHVLAVATHLADGKTTAVAEERVTQARTLIEVISGVNVDGLPVILTGDLNSFHGSATTTPPSLLLAAGFYASDLVADRVYDGQYTSSHEFLPSGTNATRIDHIFTSVDITTSWFRVRRTKESTAPSDHHPVAAGVVVYN